MPEEGAREDPAGGAADQVPEIDEEHEQQGPSPQSEAAHPEPPVAGPRSAGPPADWLEKVRLHAPGLLASPTRRAAVPPVVPHGPVAAAAQAAQPTVAAVDRATHGAGPAPPRTQRAAARQPPDETDGGGSPQLAADGPESLKFGADERPAHPPVPPGPAKPEVASERGSAERLADQAGEAGTRPDGASMPGPEPVHQVAPRPVAVNQPPPAGPLTAAYRTQPPADSFSPIVPVPASYQEHQPTLEVKPVPVARGERWPTPAPPRSSLAELDPWPATPPASAPVPVRGFAEPASFVRSPTVAIPAPSEAMPPADPASRWPTLPPAGPIENAFEVATALRSRDRWSRLVREQEST